MNKIISTVIMFFVFSFGYSQINEQHKNTNQSTVKIEGFSIQIKIDSAEELEKETFEKSDLKSLFQFEASEKEVPFSIEIICNKKSSQNETSSALSLKVSGNSNDIESFTEGFEKIKQSAIKYYKNNE